MNVNAIAVQSGDWWAIEVPEIPGLFTQVRRLDEAPRMVRDAAALLLAPGAASRLVVNTVTAPVVGSDSPERATRVLAPA